MIFHLETLPQPRCAFSALCSPSPICSLFLSFFNAFQGTSGSCKDRVCTLHMWILLFLSPHPPVPGRNWSIISPRRVRYFSMVLYLSFLGTSFFYSTGVQGLFHFYSNCCTLPSHDTFSYIDALYMVFKVPFFDVSGDILLRLLINCYFQ